jgi:APA family basic amino acid/polyamine antiporter
MARDGAFLKSVGSIHPKYGTPNVAVALTTFWAVLFAFSGSYEQVYTYVVFGGLLFGVLGGAAVFVLRYRRPEIPRVYRAWGYPIIPAVFILGLGALLVNTLFEKPVESLAGLALIALGLPAYFYWRQKRI